MNTEVSLIVAHDNNRAIGRDGHIPWMGKMKSDMDHFVNLTVNKPVIMGRTTFESLPKPLHDRTNIVLSSSLLAREGFKVVRTLQEAYDVAQAELENNQSEIMVIGGQQVYEQALKSATAVYATRIDTEIPDADAIFPELSEDEWTIATQSPEHATNKSNRFSYQFTTYIRRSSIPILSSTEDK